MLLVPTRLSPSAIHGLGVFATAAVAAGEAVWRFAPPLDQVIPDDVVAGQPQAFRDFLATYGYHAPALPGAVVLSCDHAKFLNHSEDPNTTVRGETTFAARDIAAGEEITCDYRVVVEGWRGFG